MAQGHFIVIDGPDGAGKGTQIAMLRDTLPHRYGRPASDFVFTREPGGSPFAEKLREANLSPEAKEASGSVMIQLFGAARLDHIEKIILPALAAGKVVVSDRFDAATFAYQVVAQEGGKRALELFSLQRQAIEPLFFAHHGWRTIILDVPAEIGMERSAKRRGQQRTHFDERDAAFHDAVRRGYLRYRENHRYGTHVIDASRTPCLVHHDVIGIFDRVLGKPA
jgi:dTMP kinase